MSGTSVPSRCQFELDVAYAYLMHDINGRRLGHIVLHGTMSRSGEIVFGEFPCSKTGLTRPEHEMLGLMDEKK
jgi:hypothetical protein